MLFDIDKYSVMRFSSHKVVHGFEFCEKRLKLQLKDRFRCYQNSNLNYLDVLRQ